METLAWIVVVGTIIDACALIGVSLAGGSIKKYRANPIVAVASFVFSCCATTLAFVVVF